MNDWTNEFDTREDVKFCNTKQICLRVWTPGQKEAVAISEGPFWIIGRHPVG